MLIATILFMLIFIYIILNFYTCDIIIYKKNWCEIFYSYISRGGVSELL